MSEKESEYYTPAMNFSEEQLGAMASMGLAASMSSEDMKRQVRITTAILKAAGVVVDEEGGTLGDIVGAACSILVNAMNSVPFATEEDMFAVFNQVTFSVNVALTMVLRSWRAKQNDIVRRAT